jgi:hypothetical protein
VLSPSATDGAVLQAVIKQYAFRPKESKKEVINLALAKVRHNLLHNFPTNAALLAQCRRGAAD